MLEIRVRHCHCALAGDNSDYRAAPTAEENDKLKEAMNLMEKNIQRASASETVLSPTHET